MCGFSVGGTNTYELEVDDNGDGTADRSVPPSLDAGVTDVGPRLVSAVQMVTGRDDPSRWGQLIALVFSEEITRASSQEGLDPALLTNYEVDANDVLGASLQPGGRVVLLSLRDGVGPFVSRTVTVSGIEDPLGNPMDPSPATLSDRPDHRGRGRPDFRTRVDGRRPARVRRPDPASPHAV